MKKAKEEKVLPPRLRQSDVKDSITQPTPDLKHITNPATRDGLRLFDKYGKENDKIGLSNACASTTKRGKILVYRIKSGERGKFYNPNNEGTFNYNLTGTNRRSKEPMFKFREVNQSAFEYYIRFLKTRHESILLLAEREMAM